MSSKLKGELVSRLGAPLADKICAIYAGQRLYVPERNYLHFLLRDHAIQEKYRSGVSVMTISTQFSLSTRHIYKIIRGQLLYRRIEDRTQKLVDVLGFQDARRLLEAFSGRRLSFPALSSRTQPLPQIIRAVRRQLRAGNELDTILRAYPGLTVGEIDIVKCAVEEELFR